MGEFQDGKNIHISNVRVLKEYKAGRLMLGTFLPDCNVLESPEFAQLVAKPLELPDYFTTTEAKVHRRHYWCCSVWKIHLLFTVHQESSWWILCFIILRCHDGSLSQKRNEFKGKSNIQAKVSQDDSQFVIIFFREKTFNILCHEMSRDEAVITVSLLDSPKLNVTFENKSKTE